uniref:methionyl-tRNA formyltransferase n=1 Tax=Flavobacterium sp. TaxID=239 RepID=UPI0040491AAD
MKIGFLVSGQLGLICLERIYLTRLYDVIFVVTDKKSTEIKQFCDNFRIKAYVGNPNLFKVNEFKEEIDVLLSINFLFIVKNKILNLAKLYSINIHGSLLPKYRGRSPHIWAIINNEKYTGITAHLMTEELDGGDIISQIKIPILKNYSGNDVLDIYKKLYPNFIIDILEKVTSNKIKLIPQDNNKATFFDKRLPIDGLVCWDWQKERIRNWVRALKEPYPGAFFINVLGDKVIINKVKFNDLGFQNSIRNGTVLSLNPLLVKTPNGVIELILKAQDKTILKGQILNKLNVQ